MREYSIYVHIPFCISKCKYCDFTSYSNLDTYIEKYVSKLIYEIENCKYFEKNNKDNICKTIYIGGGTPSYIDSKYIVKILKMIYKKFNIDINAEVTIEANPCSVTNKKILDYINSGINRISMGLQVADNELLKLIGRKHTYEMFVEKYNLIRKAGFDNINIDLMIGLPNQTIKNVKESINKAMKLKPQHISCYSLIIYEDTPIFNEIKNNKYKMPDDDKERDMYYFLQEKLKENGYNQYEVSNFSKQGFESKHNTMCWKQYEYIGFGAGAHSFVDNLRFSNTTNLLEYISNSLNDNVIIEETLDNHILMKEYMMLGFRMISGIDVNEFYEKFGLNLMDVFKQEIKYLTDKDLIRAINEDDSILLKLTSKGLDFNNCVCEQFV